MVVREDRLRRFLLWCVVIVTKTGGRSVGSSFVTLLQKLWSFSLAFFVKSHSSRNVNSTHDEAIKTDDKAIKIRTIRPSKSSVRPFPTNDEAINLFQRPIHQHRISTRVLLLGTCLEQPRHHPSWTPWYGMVALASTASIPKTKYRFIDAKVNI